MRAPSSRSHCTRSGRSARNASRAFALQLSRVIVCQSAPKNGSDVADYSRGPRPAHVLILRDAFRSIDQGSLYGRDRGTAGRDAAVCGPGCRTRAANTVSCRPGLPGRPRCRPHRRPGQAGQTRPTARLASSRRLCGVLATRRTTTDRCGRCHEVRGIPGALPRHLHLRSASPRLGAGARGPR